MLVAIRIDVVFRWRGFATAQFRTALSRICLGALLLVGAPWFSVVAATTQFEYDFTDQRLGLFKPHLMSPGAREIANASNGQIITEPDVPRNKLLQVRHPEGKVGPGEGSGIQVKIELEPADRYWFSYRVRFAEDFVWRAGGKLPGLLGGDDATGGQPVDGDGWSVRQMWFGGGKFAPYVYHMDKSTVWGDTLGGTESFGQARASKLANGIT